MHSSSSPSRVRLQQLVAQLNTIQSGRPWIGQTYQGVWDGLPEASFFVRPLPQLHSVAELLSHLTLWRQETILKIKTGTGSKTCEDPENWRDNHFLRQKGWAVLRAEYDDSLDTIVALLSERDDSFLDQLYYDTDFKGRFPYSFVLEGMLHHDLYHLGQLGSVCRLLREGFPKA